MWQKQRLSHTNHRNYRKEDAVMKLFQCRVNLAAVAAAPVVALAIALVSGAFTQHASAQTPTTKHPFAVGAFTTMIGDNFAFAAQKNPQSGALAGYVVQNVAAGGTRSGYVNCLDVDSTTGKARIQWHVTHSTVSSSEVGHNRQLDVTDMGEPNGITPGPDEYDDDGDCNTMSFCSTCGTAPEGGIAMVVHGNIIVKGP
jgi:hypothetical protein